MLGFHKYTGNTWSTAYCQQYSTVGMPHGRSSKEEIECHVIGQDEGLRTFHGGFDGVSWHDDILRAADF